jgi:hypothetical protein
MNFEEITGVLNLAEQAQLNGTINDEEAKLLHDCAADFVELEKARLAHFKRLGTEEVPLPIEPEIGALHDLLKRGAYATAVEKAQKVRADMGLILQDLKQRFKT